MAWSGIIFRYSLSQVWNNWKNWIQLSALFLFVNLFYQIWKDGSLASHYHTTKAKSRGRKTERGKEEKREGGERGILLPGNPNKHPLTISFQPYLFDLFSLNISKLGTWLESQITVWLTYLFLHAILFPSFYPFFCFSFKIIFHEKPFVYSPCEILIFLFDNQCFLLRGGKIIFLLPF